jgi:hypothetical protein
MTVEIWYISREIPLTHLAKCPKIMSRITFFLLPKCSMRYGGPDRLLFKLEARFSCVKVDSVLL